MSQSLGISRKEFIAHGIGTAHGNEMQNSSLKAVKSDYHTDQKLTPKKLLKNPCEFLIRVKYFFL
jgi:hypothetical protein